MRAYSLIRDQPWYRAEAFAQGLRAAGYKVEQGTSRKATPGDVLCIWNRYGSNHDLASRFEADGGTVIVAENGYLGIGGTSPKFDVHPGGPRPHHYYALAIGGHNGQGEWPSGGPERWNALQYPLKPWREEGGHILVCPNRSFGIPGRVMPEDWADQAVKRLQAQTGRPVVIRRHPGNDRPARDLAEDLKDAWAVVIWSSGAGVRALADGIPVICEAPYWICRSAAIWDGSIDSLLDEATPQSVRGIVTEYRRCAFERMAWAQWTLSEIQQGDPFRHLLAKHAILA